jgi:glycosyltransferase involved in cell wall biosynthesis
VSIIEAMASSVPVVATDVGGVSDLLGLPIQTFARDGSMVCDRGVLCTAGNTTGFAEGLQYYMDIDPVVKQEGLKRSRDFVTNNFSVTRLVRDMESIYHELAEGPR